MQGLRHGPENAAAVKFEPAQQTAVRQKAFGISDRKESMDDCF